MSRRCYDFLLAPLFLNINSAPVSGFPLLLSLASLALSPLALLSGISDSYIDRIEFLEGDTYEAGDTVRIKISVRNPDASSHKYWLTLDVKDRNGNYVMNHELGNGTKALSSSSSSWSHTYSLTVKSSFILGEYKTEAGLRNRDSYSNWSDSGNWIDGVVGPSFHIVDPPDPADLQISDIDALSEPWVWGDTEKVDYAVTNYGDQRGTAWVKLIVSNDTTLWDADDHVIFDDEVTLDGGKTWSKSGRSFSLPSTPWSGFSGDDRLYVYAHVGSPFDDSNYDSVDISPPQAEVYATLSGISGGYQPPASTVQFSIGSRSGSGNPSTVTQVPQNTSLQVLGSQQTTEPSSINPWQERERWIDQSDTFTQSSQSQTYIRNLPYGSSGLSWTNGERETTAGKAMTPRVQVRNDTGTGRTVTVEARLSGTKNFNNYDYMGVEDYYVPANSSRNVDLPAFNAGQSGNYYGAYRIRTQGLTGGTQTTDTGGWSTEPALTVHKIPGEVVSVLPNTANFFRGKTATVNVTVSNPESVSHNYWLTLDIEDPSGNPVVTHEQNSGTKTISVPGGSQRTYTFDYSIPSNASLGTYDVVEAALRDRDNFSSWDDSGNWLGSLRGGTFEVAVIPGEVISVLPDTDGYLLGETATVDVTVSNPGSTSRNYWLTLDIHDSSGNAVVNHELNNGTKSISVPGGSQRTFTFEYDIPSNALLGTYDIVEAALRDRDNYSSWGDSANWLGSIEGGSFEVDSAPAVQIVDRNISVASTRDGRTFTVNYTIQSDVQRDAWLGFSLRPTGSTRWTVEDSDNDDEVTLTAGIHTYQRSFSVNIPPDHSSGDYDALWGVHWGSDGYTDSAEKEALTINQPVHIRVPILMYHKVDETPLSKWYVATNMFKAQLKALKAYGYDPITLDDLIDMRAGTNTVPEKPVLLVFDDAYESWLTQAHPVIQEVRDDTFPLRVVGSVPTGRVGGNNSWDTGAIDIEGQVIDHLTWDQIKQMHQSGIWEFQSHTHMHPDLTQVSESVLANELEESKRLLEENLPSHTVNWLIYPFGAYNSDVKAAARSANYFGAVAVGGGVETDCTDKWDLDRVEIDSDDTIDLSGGEDNFFMSKVDPTFPLPDITINSIEYLDASGNPLFNGVARQGQEILIRVTATNNGAAAPVKVSLNIDSDSNPKNGLIYDSHQVAPSEDVSRAFGLGEQTFEWTWQVPNDAQFGQYFAIVGFHDEHYVLGYEYSGWEAAFSVLDYSDQGGILYKVPYYYQHRTEWCFYHSLTMMLKFYGFEVEPWKMAAEYQAGNDTGMSGEAFLNEAPDFLLQEYGLATNSALYDFSDNIWSDFSNEIEFLLPVTPVVFALGVKIYEEEKKSIFEDLLDYFIAPPKDPSSEWAHAVVLSGIDSENIYVSDPSGAFFEYLHSAHGYEYNFRDQSEQLINRPVSKFVFKNAIEQFRSTGSGIFAGLLLNPIASYERVPTTLTIQPLYYPSLDAYTTVKNEEKLYVLNMWGEFDRERSPALFDQWVAFDGAEFVEGYGVKSSPNSSDTTIRQGSRIGNWGARVNNSSNSNQECIFAFNVYHKSTYPFGNPVYTEEKSDLINANSYREFYVWEESDTPFQDFETGVYVFEWSVIFGNDVTDKFSLELPITSIDSVDITVNLLNAEGSVHTPENVRWSIGSNYATGNPIKLSGVQTGPKLVSIWQNGETPWGEEQWVNLSYDIPSRNTSIPFTRHLPVLTSVKLYIGEDEIAIGSEVEAGETLSVQFVVENIDSISRTVAVSGYLDRSRSPGYDYSLVREVGTIEAGSSKVFTFQITTSNTKTGDFFQTYGVETALSSYILTDSGAWSDLLFTVVGTASNTRPVLQDISDLSVDELNLVRFTAEADDSDVPKQLLIYSLEGQPVGAEIAPSTGLFTWTPSEEQGPGSYAFKVFVSDGTLTDVELVSVTVNEVNRAPVLSAIADKTVVELSRLEFTASAIDPDIPEQNLSYALVGAPNGASIHPSTGAFSWTPTTEQGPDIYTFSVQVSDGALTDSKPVTVTVSEYAHANTPPVLSSIGDKTVDELKELIFTASATDSDEPAQTLTYSLANEPTGAEIDPDTGVFTWTPTEEQGPDSYRFTVFVSDGELNDSEEITVTVNEVNLAPVLDAIGSHNATALTEFSLAVTATDSDFPRQTLIYSLVNEPAGAAISPTTGLFTWTPTEAQADSSYTFTVEVSDGTLTDSEEVTVAVTPIVSDLGIVVFEEDFDAYSTGTLTGQGDWRTYSGRNSQSVIDTGDAILGKAAGGGSIAWNLKDLTVDFNGVIRTEIYWIGYVTSASGTMSNTSSQVNLGDKDRVQRGFGFAAQRVLGTYQFTASGNDSVTAIGTVAPPADTWIEVKGEIDWAAGGLASLSYRISGDDVWLPTGIENYQISITDLDEIDEVFIRDDSGGSRIAHIRVTNIGITRTSPVLLPIADQAINEQELLQVAASAEDPDLGPQTLTFSLTIGPDGASVDAQTGRIEWTPSEEQGPGVYPFTIEVSDGEAEDTVSFAVTVNEVNEAPMLPAHGVQTIAELADWSEIIAASDSDLPAQTLSYSLSNEPSGMQINSNSGAISWTPSEAQGPDSYTFMVHVSDGTLSDSEEITVNVIEVNAAPVLADIGNMSVNEETALTFTASATDPDVPVQSLTYSLLGAPNGASINSTSGAFAWTPTEAQGPQSYTFTIQVSDGTLSDSEEITVAVNEGSQNPSTSREVILFSKQAAGGGQADLWLLDYETHELTQLTDTSQNEFQARVSPDGTTIAFLRSEAGGRPDLYVMDMENLSIHQMTFRKELGDLSEQGVNNLCWGHDGSYIVIEVGYATDEQKIYSIDLGSGIETLLFNNPNDKDLNPAINPKEPDELYFIYDNGNWSPNRQTRKVSLSTGDQTTVFPSDGRSQGQLRISDDGEWLLWQESDSGYSDPKQIWISRTDGSELFQVTDSFGNCVGGDFSPDGSKIVFQSNVEASDQYSLYVINPDGSGVEKLLGISNHSLTQPEWANIKTFRDPEEVNAAPILTGIGDKSVDENTALTFTVSATDSDVPVQSLTYSLLGAPSGASINATTGTFSWTPTESQGPGIYTFSVLVSDGILTDSEEITITVNEVNAAPVLVAIGNRSIDEETALTFTAAATDSDVPTQGLTYSLMAAPTGASINASTGAFAWTPSESQGPGEYTFTVQVSDGTLTDFEEVTVIVNEVNIGGYAEAWLEENLPVETPIELRGLAADADFDEISNLMEYAMGLNPGVADAQGHLELGLEPVTEIMALDIQCRADDPALTMVCVVSFNLNSWTEVTLNFDPEMDSWSASSEIIRIAESSNLGNGIWKLSLHETTGTKPIFVRLKVIYLP